MCGEGKQKGLTFLLLGPVNNRPIDVHNVERTLPVRERGTGKETNEFLKKEGSSFGSPPLVNACKVKKRPISGGYSKRIAPFLGSGEVPDVLDGLADFLPPMWIVFGLGTVLELFVELLQGHLSSFLLDDRVNEVAPGLVRKGTHVVLLGCPPGDGDDEARILAGDKQVLVDDGYEVLMGIHRSFGDAVMLGLDDDVLHGSWTD